MNTENWRIRQPNGNWILILIVKIENEYYYF